MPFDINAESLDLSTASLFKRKINDSMHEIVDGGWDRMGALMGVMQREREKRRVINSVKVILIDESVGEKIAVDLFTCAHQVLRSCGMGNKLKYVIPDEKFTEVQHPNHADAISYSRLKKEESDENLYSRLTSYSNAQQRSTLFLIFGNNSIKKIKTTQGAKVLKCVFDEIPSLPRMRRLVFFER